MLCFLFDLTGSTDEDEWAEEIELEEVEDEEAAFEARGKQIPSGKQVSSTSSS
jgi:hypothetical protein